MKTEFDGPNLAMVFRINNMKKTTFTNALREERSINLKKDRIHREGLKRGMTYYWYLTQKSMGGNCKPLEQGRS